MVSLRPVISKSTTPCIIPLMTVPRAPITIDITVTFMFPSVFNSLSRSRYLFFFSQQQNSQILQVLFFSFFFFIMIRSGRLVEIWWSVCISKSQRRLCVSFFRIDAGLCINHLFVWSNLNFLHNSQWITLPTQSCLVLYSFGDNLLHSIIMWLVVLSLSIHNLYLLFYCVLSILALIWLVLMAWFCAAIKRDTVSLLKFPFLSHIYAFSWEMSLVSHLKCLYSCFSSHFFPLCWSSCCQYCFWWL